MINWIEKDLKNIKQLNVVRKNNDPNQLVCWIFTVLDNNNDNNTINPWISDHHFFMHVFHTLTEYMRVKMAVHYSNVYGSSKKKSFFVYLSIILFRIKTNM